MVAGSFNWINSRKNKLADQEMGDGDNGWDWRKHKNGECFHKKLNKMLSSLDDIEAINCVNHKNINKSKHT